MGLRVEARMSQIPPPRLPGLRSSPEARIPAGRIPHATAVMVVAVSLSLISLLLSYVFYPGVAWQHEFGLLHYYDKVPAYVPRQIIGLPSGFIIEFLRAVLIVGIGGFLLTQVYYTELTEVIRAVRWRQATPALRFIVCLILVTTLGTIPLIVYHHLVWGPDDLRQHYLAHAGVADSLAYHRPYLLYLPYSIVNYVLVGIPVFAIGLFAVSRDTASTKQEHDQLIKAISDAPSCDAIGIIFRDYFNGYSDRCERYAAFSLCLAIVVTYEHYIGSLALTETATRWAWIGWFVVGIYFLAILLIALYYEHGFRESVRRLSNLHCDIRTFEKDCSVLTFIGHLMRRYLVLNIALILFGVAPTLSKFLKFY
jgi:hypothetical protein